MQWSAEIERCAATAPKASALPQGVEVGAVMMHHHALRIARGASEVGERDRLVFVRRRFHGNAASPVARKSS